MMSQFATARQTATAHSGFSLAALRLFAHKRAMMLAGLILLALVVQGMSFAVSNAHRAHMALMAASGSSPVQTQTIMLCTLQGFKAVQIAVDAEGAPLASPAQSGDEQHLMVGKLYPLCIVAQAFALLTPSLGHTTAPLFVTERLEPSPLPTLAPQPVAHTSPPQQAPPAA